MNHEEDCLIGIKKVCVIVGFSKSSISRKIHAKEFPEPVYSSGNVVRWSLNEVRAWRDAQFLKRDERLKALAQHEVRP